jgi:hypothetical protein
VERLRTKSTFANGDDPRPEATFGMGLAAAFIGMICSAG